MCGFTGFVDIGLRTAHPHEVCKAMTDALAHRGPDDSGYWSSPETGVFLGHRRLAILDLSEAGHQPMLSQSGRLVLVYNGEIYNHLELRAALEQQGLAPKWKGHSDTETLLAGFEAWGVTDTLQKTIGMFAFALWDQKDQRLTLARDRIGEKPLYFGWQQNCLLFGSELKSLRAHPAFTANINRGALALLTRHNYIPSPYSIYEGIQKLRPGHIAIFDRSSHGLEPAVDPIINPYWSLQDVERENRNSIFEGSVDQAVDELERLLLDSVEKQMLSDVPIGAFLSGGIDSSTIAALMQLQSDRPINSFTIGFNESGFNEAEHAKAVASHLGTNHTELYVTSTEAMDVIPRLPSLYDEPFADSSQIPTFLVSQMTRQHVTVALSGDAGDELFGGYNRYFLTREVWHNISRIPKFARKFAAGTLTSISPSQWDRLLNSLFLLAPSRRFTHPGDKLHKLAGIVRAGGLEDIYRGLVSHEVTPETLVIGAQEPKTVLTDENQWDSLRDFEHRMMFLDTLSYLPDDILAKVDRAAMGVSLETRVPFLDHRIVDFAWRLPLDYKIRKGTGKWILKQVLYKHVPQGLIDRPKMGFGVPIDVWLRGPLKDWAASLIDQKRLVEEGFFDPAPILKKWQEHQSGERNWQYHLWDILMFQAWLENQ